MSFCESLILMFLKTTSLTDILLKVLLPFWLPNSSSSPLLPDLQSLSLSSSDLADAKWLERKNCLLSS